MDEIEYYDWGEGPKFGRSSNGGGSGPNFEKYIKYPVDMTDITAQERSESDSDGGLGDVDNVYTYAKKAAYWYATLK